MQWLASLFFTLFLFIWTFLYAVFFVCVAVCLPFPRRAGLARGWALVLLAVLKWSCRLDYTVEGREHIPADNHIALWKHASTWETLAIGVVFPRQVWVLKRELLWIPFVGWGIRLLHAIAIDRGAGHTAVSQVIEQGTQRLQEGDWVVIFPEGTRMPAGQTPPLWSKRRIAGVPDRQAGDSSGAQRGILLAATRAAQASGDGARGDRAADSCGWPRSARYQCSGAGVDRGTSCVSWSPIAGGPSPHR